MNSPGVLGSLLIFLLGLGCCEAPDTPVKLCGREFIRALIASCGGSSWKLDPPRVERQQQLEQLDVDDRKSLSSSLTPPPGALLHWINSEQQPDRLSEATDQSLTEEAPTAALGVGQGQAVDPLLPSLLEKGLTRRLKRDMGPASSCCAKGCRKSQLKRFC
ncbi:insulin-like 3 precursor [Ornithorhynchus anatinus]|uniref:Insulin like 3 n=1 Tax=Ornithorhynchus anatinus TaxID=9258 RepID=B1AAP8_ORNAN|nr:insulin-like 3 precursor [Ornithorhynchus anatinus]ACA13576.1 relaxin family locus C type II [Ornithorhynchus anatinus]